MSTNKWIKNILIFLPTPSIWHAHSLIISWKSPLRFPRAGSSSPEKGSPSISCSISTASRSYPQWPIEPYGSFLPWSGKPCWGRIPCLQRPLKGSPSFLSWFPHYGRPSSYPGRSLGSILWQVNLLGSQRSLFSNRIILLQDSLKFCTFLHPFRS